MFLRARGGTRVWERDIDWVPGTNPYNITGLLGLIANDLRQMIRK